MVLYRYEVMSRFPFCCLNFIFNAQEALPQPSQLSLFIITGFTLSSLFGAQIMAYSSIYFTMNKCYLLLRNNKETGPLSITELLQLSLTPNDLVWVQGKSAGWRYPSEIDELKTAVSKESFAINAVVSQKAQPSAADPKKEEGIAPKTIFVSLPPVKKQPATKTFSSEEKAEAQRQKALMFSENKDAIPEMAYSRSLDDIKEEYSEWIQEQKKGRKPTSINKPLAFTALLAAIIAIFFFILQWHPKTEKPAQSFIPATRKVAPATTQTNNTTPYKEVESKPKTTINQLSKQKAPEKDLTTTVVKLPAMRQPLSTAVKIQHQPSAPALKEAVLRQRNATVPITDLIETSSRYIQSEDGIGLSINLHNKSGESIRVAAIDVIYFDKAKVQTIKETLYFSNVLPGTTLTKNSSMVKAASASYQIGLVSAESAGLYVIQ
jgi:hypothetical protein